jgi:hypothetical protein
MSLALNDHTKLSDFATPGCFTLKAELLSLIVANSEKNLSSIKGDLNGYF